MTLKPLSETDRLYFEMRSIYDRLGIVLRDYEAAKEKDAPRVKPQLAIIDPFTGRPFKRTKKKRAFPKNHQKSRVKKD